MRQELLTQLNKAKALKEKVYKQYKRGFVEYSRITYYEEMIKEIEKALDEMEYEEWA